MADPRDGLTWITSYAAEIPSWTREPDLDAVHALIKSELNEEQDVKVSIHSRCVLSKIYAVECASELKFMLRVSLPVDPQYKTLSEVATLKFVRLNTSIPVPRPITFNARPKDGFPFEWTLMDRMPGQPLGSAWKTLSWDAKCNIVKTVAEYMADLHKTRFPAIGSLYQASQLPVPSKDTPSDVSSDSPRDETCVVDRMSSNP